MRVLFSAETPLTLTSYQSVLRELGERGHEVVDRHPPGARDRLARPAAGGGGRAARHDRAGGVAEGRPLAGARRPTSARRSTCSSSSGRGSTRPTAPARGSARRSRPPPWRGRRSAAARAARRAIGGAVRAGRAGGADERRDRAVAGRAAARRRPVHAVPRPALRSSPTSCARRRRSGCASAICVKSWDNLSSKSVIRPVPDRLFVWNEVQRGEAASLHGIPPERVVVTGAQCFDDWFDWPPRPRDEFAARAGLDPFEAVSSSTHAARRGRASRRSPSSAAGSPRCARTAGRSPRRACIVRPAPEAPADLARRGLRRPGRRVGVPARRARPDRPRVEGRLLRLDLSLGRRRRPEHQRDDRGGDRRPARADRARPRVRAGPAGDAALPLPARGRRRAAHGRADARGARRPARAGDRRRGRRRQRTRAFVSEFVRPFGLDVAATPLFVDEVERFARSAAPRPQRTPASLLPLRPLLVPLAARAGR